MASSDDRTRSCEADFLIFLSKQTPTIRAHHAQIMQKCTRFATVGPVIKLHDDLYMRRMTGNDVLYVGTNLIVFTDWPHGDRRYMIHYDSSVNIDYHHKGRIHVAGYGHNLASNTNVFIKIRKHIIEVYIDLNIPQNVESLKQLVKYKHIIGVDYVIIEPWMYTVNMVGEDGIFSSRYVHGDINVYCGSDFACYVTSTQMVGITSRRRYEAKIAYTTGELVIKDYILTYDQLISFNRNVWYDLMHKMIV